MDCVVIGWYFLFRECIRNDLINGGCVKSVLNSVEIFKNVPESAKIETFRCSLGAVDMCIRLTRKAKIYFIFYINIFPLTEHS